MRKTISGAVAALLLAGGIALSSPAAYASEETVCVPAEAWTEVIEHPAVGEPTVTIPNPDYVPGTPEVPAQGEPTVTVPDVEEPTADEPQARVAALEPTLDEQPAEQPADALAQTVSDLVGMVWTLTGGALAVAIGALLTVLGLRRR